MKYPELRTRRSRQSNSLRNLVAESSWKVNQLIYPLFVSELSAQPEAISTLPEVYRHSQDSLFAEVQSALEYGISTIALFPVIAHERKDASGSFAQNPENLAARITRKLKTQFPQLIVINDIALDPFTSHGQDGLLDDQGYVTNDLTVAKLVEQAVNYAEAGSDVLACSDMMDGRIGAIRSKLEQLGYHNTILLSYTAKYSSCLYGPFRDAVAASALLHSDKSTYQMDVRNGKEAQLEAQLDLDEGADWLMVKPALTNLDIVASLSQTYAQPVFAYQVSGEYAMLKFAAKQNCFSEQQAVFETLNSIFRAGARGIFSYYSLQVAKWLAEKS